MSLDDHLEKVAGVSIGTGLSRAGSWRRTHGQGVSVSDLTGASNVAYRLARFLFKCSVFHEQPDEAHDEVTLRIAFPRSTARQNCVASRVKDRQGPMQGSRDLRPRDTEGVPRRLSVG